MDFSKYNPTRYKYLTFEALKKMEDNGDRPSGFAQEYIDNSVDNDGHILIISKEKHAEILAKYNQEQSEKRVVVQKIPAAGPIPQERPIVPSIGQVKSFVKALFTGQKVSEEVTRKRIEICSSCPLVRENSDGQKWCGQCGCSVSSENKKLRNLAAYEENLPEWGCKHPEGSKWKNAGL